MRIDPRRLVALVVLSSVLVACGGAASQPPATRDPSAGAAPTGSGTSDCVAAPAPPDKQEGWTSAVTAPSVFPVIVNSSGSLTCGQNRLLFTFLDAADNTVAKPDRSVSISIYDLGRDGVNPTSSATGAFVWGIENERGFYTANVSFPEAGRWGVEFTTAVAGGTPEKIRATFDVSVSSPVVRVGDRAPATDTPTATSVGGDLARISTDQKPDPAFYRISVKAALAEHQPFVLIFATPKFCKSAQCGPTLDRVKPLAAKYQTVAFIHVEPYKMVFQNGSLQAVLDAQSQLQTVPVVDAWGLLSEPWVFVVDRNGVVTASFEGVVSTDEIAAAVDAVK
jgi:hypothetical protein